MKSKQTTQADIDYVKYLFAKDVIEVKEGYLVNINVRDNTFHGFSTYTVTKQVYLDYLAAIEVEKEAERFDSEKNLIEELDEKQVIKSKINSLYALVSYIRNEMSAISTMHSKQYYVDFGGIEYEYYHDLNVKMYHILSELESLFADFEILDKEERRQQEIQRLFYDKEAVTVISSEEETKEILSFVDSLQPDFYSFKNQDNAVTNKTFIFRIFLDSDDVSPVLVLTRAESYFLSRSKGYHKSVSTSERLYKFFDVSFFYDYLLFVGLDKYLDAISEINGDYKKISDYFYIYRCRKIENLGLDSLIYVDDEIEDFGF